MGIPGLLNALKSIVNRVHVSDYRGLRVAVDAHCWLHRASYSCCRELTEGIKTSKHIDFFMELLNILIRNNITPVIVFDGRPLPAKAVTNNSRRTSRAENLARAREAEAEGRLGDAHTHYQKSVSVTPDMVFQLIKTLREKNIDFIVSPYESDAQLAFLSLSGYVDVVLTEDSDALVYGCRRVLYKIDKEGYGHEIRRRSLGANQRLSFLNWNDDQFKLMCCLAGCDYAPKIKNVGIITAHRLVAKHKNFRGVVQALQASKFIGIDEEYVAKLQMAMNTFKHQTVYNPTEKKMQPLTPFKATVPLSEYHFSDSAVGDMSDMDAQRLRGLAYLGEVLPARTSADIAEGLVHPITLVSVLPLRSNESNGDVGEVVDEQNDRELLKGPASFNNYVPEAAQSASPHYSADGTRENVDEQSECAAGTAQGLWAFPSASSPPSSRERGVSPARQLEAIAGGISHGPLLKSAKRDLSDEEFMPLPIETLQRRKRRLGSPRHSAEYFATSGPVSPPPTCVPFVVTHEHDITHYPGGDTWLELASSEHASLYSLSTLDRDMEIQSFPFQESAQKKDIQNVTDCGFQCHPSAGMIYYRRKQSPRQRDTGGGVFELPNRRESEMRRNSRCE